MRNSFTYKISDSLKHGSVLTSDTENLVSSAMLTLSKIANGLEFDKPSLTFDEAKKILKDYLLQQQNEYQLSLFPQISHGNDCCITKKVLQVLCYNIGDFADNEEYLQTATLEILDDKWSDSFFLPLCYSLISQWGSPVANDIREILQHKANGNVQKDMLVFLGKNGVESLVEYLNVKGRSVDSAPSLFYMSNIFDKIYFRFVIQLYYHFKSTDIDEHVINELSITLSKHNDPITSKIVIPELIIRAHGSRTSNGELRISQLLKDELIALAEKHIGCIGDNNAWGSIGGNQRELTKAHQILQQLLIDQILRKVFSQSRGNDHFEERAAFWSRYTHKIAETTNEYLGCCLKIHSQNPNITKEKLLGKRNIPFIKVIDPISNKDGNVAVIMRMHNYTIIEFLEVGCAYFYRRDNRISHGGMSRHMYADVWSMPVDNVVQLKVDNALFPERNQSNANNQIWNISLKMAHRGNTSSWYSLFSSWLARNIPSSESY